MSIYEGSITLRVRFAADNGYEADNALSAIATEIQDEWNEDLPRDDIKRNPRTEPCSSNECVQRRRSDPAAVHLRG